MNYNCHRIKRVDGRRWLPQRVVSFSFLSKQKFLMVLIVCGLVIHYLGFTTPSIRRPVDLQGSEINVNVAGSASGIDADNIEFSTWTSSVVFAEEEQEEGQEEAQEEKQEEELHERQEEGRGHEEEKEEEGRNLNLENHVTENINKVSTKGYTQSPVTEHLVVSTAKTKSVVVTKRTPKPKEEMSCHLPLLNPFDESILKYIEEPTPIQCINSTRYPLLFKTDLRSTLIQIDDPAKYGFYFCCYSSFQRVDGHKKTVNVSSKCKPIKKEKTRIPEHIEFIQISCANETSTSAEDSPSPRLIIDMFGFIRLKPAKLRDDIEKGKNAVGAKPNGQNNTSNLKDNSKPKPKPKSSARKVNVVAFGVDAMSHMNFIRVMPQTYKYLTGNLSGTGLWGYTKIGDNTFPNVLSATTGLFEGELDTVAHCWNDTDVFDSCPFIWKDFARQGYATAYGEDAVWMSSFNYCKDGFNLQPTDYYEATLTGHQDEQIGHVDLGNANACYGPRLGFQVSVDFLRKMAVAMDKERRYFQFIWATSLTHDNLNDGKHGDRSLLETLQWFKNEGYFEDTVFILMSDHGIRWGDIRDTFQGKMEERMPFLYFVFPQWFKEAYPAAVRNVMENKHKLTTPFDLYATFQDLLSLQNIQSEKIHRRSSDLNENSEFPRGISLFLEIPPRRSCADAEIPEHWCVCHTAVAVGAEHLTLVYEAGQKVVETINELFKEHSECEELELKVILNAQVVESSENGDLKNLISTSTSAKPSIHKERITFSLSFSVSPSNGTFEATATRNADGQWVVSNEISRINLYGDQSHCVEDHDLKKFCFCPKPKL